jgi:hypothetical protein
MMMNSIRNPSLLMLTLLVTYSVIITGLVSPRYHPSMVERTSLRMSPQTDKNLNSKHIWKTIWDRMDTLESAGFTNSNMQQQEQQQCLEDTIRQDKNEVIKPYYPPLVARGGGFKRFMILMALGMAYKWYRARFINKVRLLRFVVFFGFYSSLTYNLHLE